MIQIQAIRFNTTQHNSKLNVVQFGNKLSPLESSITVASSYKKQIENFDIPKIHNLLTWLRNKQINKFDIDPNTIVNKDMYPIALPHLLVIRPNEPILSLAEISEDKDFRKSLKCIAKRLQQIFPNQEIIFFEHGSGTVANNGQKFVQSAGKSVMFAHGHFCVLPKQDKQVYHSIITEVRESLGNNHWHNLPLNTHRSNDFFPDFKEIADSHNIKLANMHPYILCSRIGDKNTPDASTVFIKELSSSETPSQLLRKIIAKYSFGSSDETYWNWKTLLNDYEAGNISKYMPHIKKLEEFDKQFERKLDTRI